MRKGEVVIPDDNPGQSLYLTIKDIRRILTDCYGIKTGDRMTPEEVNGVVAALEDGNAVELCGANMIIQPEGVGLYCAYQKRGDSE
jgi:hypothetical protein